MIFSTLTSLVIPEGIVTRITSEEGTLWENRPPLVYTDLVPNALYTDGSILDGVGYRRGVSWNGSQLRDASAFTAVGLMPIDGSISHDIYVYGLNFSGTTNNRFCLWSERLASIAESTKITEGFSGTYISSITKLGANYFKITTRTYSARVSYFTVAGVTISGLTPIVTMDEPIR